MTIPPGTITLSFSDIAGSTRGWELATPAMDEALGRHDARGGYVCKTVGDPFCAAFATSGAGHRHSEQHLLRRCEGPR